MTVILKKFKFNRRDYHRMAEVGIIKPTDRVELINGEIIAMSPIKSLHGGTVNFLNTYLHEALEERTTITVQNPIIIGETSEPEPDLVVAKYRKDNYRTEHPHPKDILLLIEVADTTLQKDRRVKVPLYAKANVSEYWIVNLKNKQVEVFRKPKNGKYEEKIVVKKGEHLTASQLKLSLAIDEIFI